MENKELFICECHNIEHQVTFIYDDDDECKAVYMYIHLTKKSFWERLKLGLKYIFGYQCRYGAFEEMILNPEDSDRLQKVVDAIRRGYILMTDCSEEGGERFNIYYDASTTRSPRFEQNCQADGFHIKPMPKKKQKREILPCVW